MTQLARVQLGTRYTLAYSPTFYQYDMAHSTPQLGRHTLERSMRFIEATWPGTKVVYGDTDSVFVHVPGASKESAFRIGQEIAEAITAREPRPMELKFDKTRKPKTGVSEGLPLCSLETNFLLTSKYKTKIEARVKAAQDAAVNITNLKQSNVVLNSIHKDPMREPRLRGRYPYFVLRGDKGMTLASRCRDAYLLLEEWAIDPHNTLSLDYETTGQQTLLLSYSRFVNIIGQDGSIPVNGVDVSLWYEQLPTQVDLTSEADAYSTLQYKPSTLMHRRRYVQIQQATVAQFFQPTRCVLCNDPKAVVRDAQLRVCDECLVDRAWCTYQLQDTITSLESKLGAYEEFCNRCCGFNVAEDGKSACVSIDCRMFYQRVRAARQLQQQKHNAIDTDAAIEIE
ncbi:hypothetical protein SARC_07024 [Sphaeroforma arctica JP610]|uniref:DNA-directed DNA polymerase n=1 Tax=Sphaeroforma arctica JP610 TaxID=667725 RepID=A0A0L0FVG5_9EUKA|nr:hypothetical protein SARC_07024 [Sphaeroforma arctica JP610]KNC80614.1 hypothetical protein SARC_07024 [Sphaeroforma arctica JP610]|eukprot:XP_014154516.1 hypothetical protein SARC_07024 [Sphaeroforma arctica JP610]